MSLPSQFSIAPQTLDRVTGALVGIAAGCRAWAERGGEDLTAQTVAFAIETSSSLNDRASLPIASTEVELFATAIVCGAHFPAFEASAARALHSVAVTPECAQWKDHAAECAGIVSAAVHKGPESVPSGLRAVRHSFRPAGDSVRAALMAAYAAAAAVVGDINYDSFRATIASADETLLSHMLHAAMFGAFRGVSAIPTAEQVRRQGDATWLLVRSGVLGARSRQPDEIGWPTSADLTSTYSEQFELHAELVTVQLPDHVQGVLTVGSFSSIAPAVDSGAQTVISLCRTGAHQVPDHVDHAQVWLTDSEGYATEPNLKFVLAETSRYIAEKLLSGDRVHVHCVEGRSRTATIAAFVLAHLGVELDSCYPTVTSDLYWATPAERLVAVRADMFASWSSYQSARTGDVTQTSPNGAQFDGTERGVGPGYDSKVDEVAVSADDETPVNSETSGQNGTGEGIAALDGSSAAGAADESFDPLV